MSGQTAANVAKLFGFSTDTLRRRFATITRDLKLRFVPDNLGLHHISRVQAFEHSTYTSRTLFLDEHQIDSRAKITIWDATYIRMEKSSNIGVQQGTYSMHKRASLFKPMICVLPDGYIYDIVPFNPATLNDASIMNNITHLIPNFNEHFVRGDVFILDRGFRDAARVLRSNGFKVFLPSFIERGSRQLTTQQANRSRK